MIGRVEVLLYGPPGNNAVVHMPQRRNPGVVIQADTLFALAREARELANSVRSRKGALEVTEAAEGLARSLEEIFEHLENQVVAAGERLQL